jgi:mandelamide amidase
MSKRSDPMDLGARELVRLVARGELSAKQCARAALARAREAAGLNAFTHIDEERVLKDAGAADRRLARGERAGALAGLPFVVKDNIDVAGTPTAAGAPLLRESIARRHAPVVARLLEAGAILLGKTGMHELALGATSSNPAGAVRNPHDPSRIPGGSSGGTAAALAARIAPAGLGSDTAGSVRIPSALCGIVGLRPSTFGVRHYSDEGLVPLAPVLDTVGPMARTVADVALLHAVITGTRVARTPSPRGLRLGGPRRWYWEHLDPDVAQVAERALQRLRESGVRLEEVDASAWYALASEAYMTLIMHGIVHDLVPSLERSSGLSEPNVLARVASRDVRTLMHRADELRIPDTQAETARPVVREKLVPAYRDLFETHGLAALAFPTVPLAAPPVREEGDTAADVVEIEGRQFSAVLTLIRNTHATSALGAPGLSVPAGLTQQGLPVGLELDGLPGDDEALLGVGIAIEQLLEFPSSPGPAG